MKLNHKFFVGDSRKKKLKDNSINLVVTSPPYPMIKMWDEIFCSLNKKIKILNYNEAFDLMNKELKKVYFRSFKALKNGGFLIVNIGDATRNIGGTFRLFSNGSRTIEICQKIGFTVLPQIYWWKPTNSPNKFLGSGMYPSGAYVTLENEHILIFRKGKQRIFSKIEEKLRKKSAYFQNERNVWFSNIWTDIRGTKQDVNGLKRKRSGAFPIELVYRLINMYSIEGDLVWDPFGGIGTTTIATIMAGRSSIITEIDETFVNFSLQRIKKLDINKINQNNQKRIEKGINSAKEKLERKNQKPKYINTNYGIVYTNQEKEIKLPVILSIQINKRNVTVDYK